MHPRVLKEHYEDHKLTLTVEGPAGTSGGLRIVRHADVKPILGKETAPAEAEFPRAYATACQPGLVCNWEPLAVHFPPGEGWKTITVTLTW